MGDGGSWFGPKPPKLPSPPPHSLGNILLSSDQGRGVRVHLPCILKTILLSEESGKRTGLGREKEFEEKIQVLKNTN